MRSLFLQTSFSVFLETNHFPVSCVIWNQVHLQLEAPDLQLMNAECCAAPDLFPVAEGDEELQVADREVGVQEKCL